MSTQTIPVVETGPGSDPLPEEWLQQWVKCSAFEKGRRCRRRAKWRVVVCCPDCGSRARPICDGCRVWCSAAMRYKDLAPGVFCQPCGVYLDVLDVQPL